MPHLARQVPDAATGGGLRRGARPIHPGQIAVVTVNTADLKATLAKFAKIVNTKPRRPVLAGIRIEAKDSKITFHGTDLELYLSMWIDAKCDAKCAAVVDYRLFVAAVKAVKTDKAILSIHDQKVVVENDGGAMSVTCATVGGVGDYPTSPAPKTFEEVLTKGALPAKADLRG